MRTITIRNTEVKLFDGLDSVSADRKSLYNHYMIMDSGIGGDLEALDNHYLSIIKLIDTNPQEAKKECLNARQCMHFITSNVNPEHMAFAALVKSIGKEERNDLSEAGLMETRQKLLDLKITGGAISRFIGMVKKNFRKKNRRIFPNIRRMEN